MKRLILIPFLLLSACGSTPGKEPPMHYDRTTGEMRPCAHIGMLGDCKHFM
ncbi:hypothetical protein DSM110093_03857 (plasmid) [Sulfitobacter sp. DSM 110093]|nr:hypothetical protein DSM110093_03596 [Sulfitobacter sp. DSM 110093]UOA34022.1 hypothetical protein DSM110093_03857 [Sulfitobacter sp. DSM 110093]